MKSYQLTVTKKDRIVADVLNDTFKKQKISLENELKKLADKIYDTEYGFLAEFFEPIPEHFFERGCCFYVNFQGQRPYMTMSEKRIIPINADNYSNKNIITYNDDHDFTKEFYRITKELSNIDENISVLRSTIKSLVNSVNTSKQLLEIWPNGEEYIRRYSPEDKSKNQLAILGSTIDEMINDYKGEE